MLQAINPLTMIGNPDAARAMVAAFLCEPETQAGLMNQAVAFVESVGIVELQCWSATDFETECPSHVPGAFAIDAVNSPASLIQTLAAHLCAELSIPFAVEFDADSGEFVVAEVA